MLQIPADGEILERLNIEALNEMQLQTGKAIAATKDVLLLAPTGSGKTLAYLLPVLKMLRAGKNPQCLVLVPSRELALQIESVWKKMGTGIKANTCYGGHPMETEINNLKVPPALIIGTPGRIKDHLTRATIPTEHITTLVLDEFDKSLELGFEEDMSFIIERLDHLRKRILVSATHATAIPAFAGVRELAVLDFTSPKPAASLEIKTVVSSEKDKIETLFRLLCHIGAEPALIFCNHREAAERVHKLLAERYVDAVFFHGGLEQEEREQVLSMFRNGSVWFMVATGLAARGLDIPEVKHIIHYHLPASKEEFVHRNGRTARQQATGFAWLIMHGEEELPAWLDQRPAEQTLGTDAPLPPAPPYDTIYVSGGRKDKLNKTDIVGFFSKVGMLGKDDIGLIEVKDRISYAAVKKGKVKQLLSAIKDQKMKGKKYRILKLK